MRLRAASGVLAAAAALVLARLWAMPLAASLWLDEFGTVWVTGGGLSGVVERTRLFPQSIPYAAVVAVARSGFGSTELCLRLPSFLAMLAAALLVARLGRACFGAGAGGLAAGAFLLFPGVEFAAADARPYAFGVLAATAALLSLRAWLQAGRTRDALGYVLATAMAIYFHYLFAAALAGHAIYAAYRRRRGAPVSLQAFASAAAGLILLLVPAAKRVAAMAANRRSHEFGTLPDAMGLFNALVPVRVLGFLIPAVLVAFVLCRARIARAMGAPSSVPDGLVLLLSAALAPPLVLFAVSRTFSTPLFQGRYLLETAPAWAALLGGALARVEPPAAGRLSLAGALLAVFLVRGELARLPIGHGREDWRGALAAAEGAAPGAPVLLAGSFAEARDPALAADPRHQEYLTEPVRYYAPRTAAIALPLGSAPGADALAGRLAGPALSGRRFVLIERASRLGSRVEWVEGLASARGFAGREIWHNGPLRVRLYERSGEAR